MPSCAHSMHWADTRKDWSTDLENARPPPEQYQWWVGRLKCEAQLHPIPLPLASPSTKGFTMNGVCCMHITFLWLGRSCLAAPRSPEGLGPRWLTLAPDPVGHHDYLTGPRSCPVATFRYTWLCPPLVACPSQHTPGHHWAGRMHLPLTRSPRIQALTTHRWSHAGWKQSGLWCTK